MKSAYFSSYADTFSRVLMAEFVDDLQNGHQVSRRVTKQPVSATFSEIAHLLPPFPVPTAMATTRKS